MTLQDFIQFFTNQLQNIGRKSQQRAINKFIAILNDLEQREMTSVEKQAIVNELFKLELGPDFDVPKKGYNGKLSKFTHFLKQRFNLVCQGFYTNMGLIFGMIMGNSAGIIFGSVINPEMGIAIGLSIGTGIGMAIGVAIGAFKDREAQSKGHVMQVK